VIALDGPAGAGKSSVARATAAALGFTYLDSGAMYRCVALGSLRQDAAPAEIAARAEITLGPRVLLDGADVTEAIRSAEVSARASLVAADPCVRSAMVAQQRRLLGSGGGWVAEGRDIGTVVWPQAELKLFLTASAEERARRRAAQTGEPYASVLAQQIERDARDAGRVHSPLTRAADAVELDTTQLDLAAVVERIVFLARQRGAQPTV
jgi:cytidylate kinase